MSTGTKRKLAAAAIDADAFSDLFAGCFDRWEFAGSVRRRVPEVSDVEHVVIPAFATKPADALFGEPVRVNRFLERADELVASGELTKHLYANGFRWGEKYRGFDYRGHTHEVFCATPDNFGPTLAIRTGPADFSKRLVTGLLRNGLRNKDGQVWRCIPCAGCGPYSAIQEKCPECGGTCLIPTEVIPCPSEAEYFKLCGVPFMPPERRF